MKYLKLPLVFAVIALLAGSLSGCGVFRAVFGPESAIQISQTREQKHWAWVGTYDLLQQSAEDIVNSTDVPIELRRAVQKAEQCTTPAVDQANSLFAKYGTEKFLFGQGQSTLDKIEIAATNYDRWRVDADKAIENLVNAMSGDDSTCTP